MIKTILSENTYQKIFESLNNKQKKEWNNFVSIIYADIDYIKDRTRRSPKDVIDRINFLKNLICTMPSFEVE